MNRANLFVILMCAFGCADTVAETVDTPAPKNEGVPVTPPFSVNGELDGLLMMWFDDDGLHSARTREDIPGDSRRYVRVDSLQVHPDKRLDADHVYIADVREAGSDGSYPVKKYSRTWLEERAFGKPDANPQATQLGDGGVVLYMASWCGACRSAGAYMKKRGVSFVEKDIEKDPAANAEMRKKAAAAGLKPRGVPVIDFRGSIILGFNKSKLARLIDG